MENLLKIERSKFKNQNSVVKKIGNKQILVVKDQEDFYALDNRCPHEGYPLKEGGVDSQNKTLTCFWHNWKFDLKNGKCLIGGDNVRTYPVSIEGDYIVVDAADPSIEEIEKLIMDGFEVAFKKREYGRISRELSRLYFNKVDPLKAVKKAIIWSWDKFEYGMGHAYAVTADWLNLYHQENEPIKKIAALTEAIDHISFDSLRHSPFSYSENVKEYSESLFLEAIENENEEDAIALLRGAFKQNKFYKELEKTLVQAALNHYQGFGHSIIYVYKAGELIQYLKDKSIEELILLTLVRHLVYATREDLIPEFKGYHETLEEFELGSHKEFSPLNENSAKQSYNWLLSLDTPDPERLFEYLLQKNAENFLKYNMDYQFETDNSVNDNIGWLDFTHAITMANAINYFCHKYPRFWKQGLLQLVCFYGRNKKYTSDKVQIDDWRVENVEVFEQQTRDNFYDHGLPLPIFSAHIVKTSLAVFEELNKSDNKNLNEYLLASLNRFLRSPIKAKHVLRTVSQGFQLVARDF